MRNAFPTGNLYKIQYLVTWGFDKERKEYSRWMRRIFAYMAPDVSKSLREVYSNYRHRDLGKTTTIITEVVHKQILGLWSIQVQLQETSSCKDCHWSWKLFQEWAKYPSVSFWRRKERELEMFLRMNKDPKSLHLRERGNRTRNKLFRLGSIFQK